MMTKRTIGLAGAGLAGAVLLFLWRSSLPTQGPADQPDVAEVASPLEPRELVSSIDADPARQAVGEEPAGATAFPEETSTSPPVAEDDSELPAGVLEVRLLRGAVPETSGFVHRKLFDYDELPEDPWSGVEGMQAVAFGSEGVARFEFLEAGTVHRLGVESPAGSGYVARRNIRMPKSGEGLRVDVALGEARIHGVVYGEGGSPLRDVELKGWSLATKVSQFATTDATGAYELLGITDGAWHVTASQGRSPGETSEQQANVLAKDGLDTQLDFGSPDPWATWRARVVDRVGHPVPNVGRYGNSPGRIELTHLDSGVQQSFEYTEEGTFEEQLPTGRYRVELTGPSRPNRSADAELGIARDEFVLESTGSTEDLVLPGITLRGTVFGPGGEPFGDSYPDGLSVSLLNENRSVNIASTTLRADGTYVLAGLPPGNYWLNTWPAPPAPQSLVELKEQDTSVQWDISIAE